jgi:hypothetical protein
MPDFLPDLPVEGILDCLKRSPGHEYRTGKMDGPDSSAALVVNGFGWFLNRADQLPAMQGVPSGQVTSLTLEAEMRYPWKEGRHPWLDVGMESATTLIGLESRRYEPFRPAKNTGFSEIYDRPVWREKLPKFTQLRDDLVAGRVVFEALDAVQLVKSAYGIWTRAEKRASGAVLIYLYADPVSWASGKNVDPARKALHRRELAEFSNLIAGDGVTFVRMRWSDLLAQWAGVPALAAHAAGLQAMFGDLG